MKMITTACIEAPVEKVWATLADVTNIVQWAPVESASCVGDKKTGAGTKRVCNLKGGVTIEEEWTQWKEGDYYTYIASGIPLVKMASNKWSVETVNGKTLLRSEADVKLKGGVFGKLLEPLFRILSKRAGADALAAFKYLVETGRPFTGKRSTLPRVSPVC